MFINVAINPSKYYLLLGNHISSDKEQMKLRKIAQQEINKSALVADILRTFRVMAKYF
jgi:hypothetical protein